MLYFSLKPTHPPAANKTQLDIKITKGNNRKVISVKINKEFLFVGDNPKSGQQNGLNGKK